MRVVAYSSINSSVAYLNFWYKEADLEYHCYISLVSSLFVIVK